MDETLRDLQEAAKYLRMSIRAVQNHLWVHGDLVADDRGKFGRLLFRQDTLDRFNRTRRHAGRPKGGSRERQSAPDENHPA